MNLSPILRGLILLGLSSYLTTFAFANSLQIPNTSAGNVAAQRLHAFNSGDLTKLNAFKKAHDPQMSVERELAFKNMIGELEVLRITRDEPYRIAIIVREKDGDRVGTMELEVDDKNPSQVTKFGLIPMPVTPEDLMPQRLSSVQAWKNLVHKADKLTQQDRFSGTIAIAHDGKLLHSKSWGYADRTKKLNNSVQTRFRVGSMYKMLTAVAILQLVDQGRIALDVPISRYLPNYPNTTLAKQVTVHQLLTHTAGTGDIFTDEYAAKREQVREHVDYIKLFGSRATDFVPGSREEYSNYGFVLLGAIIEQVTGQPYHKVIQKHILVPAGMKNTGTEPESSMRTRISVGYTRSEKGLVDNRASLPWRGTAAGGGYSTVTDLLQFGKALLDGRLLSPAWLKKATQAQTESKLYGYGFQLGGTASAPSFGHIGGADGMDGAFRVYPKTGDILVVLSNFDPPAADELLQYYGNRMPLFPSKRSNLR